MKKIQIIVLFIVCNLYSQKGYEIAYTYKDVTKAMMESSLLINNSEAVFKIHDDRARGIIDLSEGEVSFLENDDLSRFCYSNSEKVYYRFLSYNNEFIYVDNYNEKTNWEINNDVKKTINGYECVQAKLFMNGRRYTAWFTYKIPIRFGPMKLHNLPGLIVEVKEDSGFFEIKLKGIAKIDNLKELIQIKNYVLNKKVMYTYEQYEKRIVEIEVNNKIRWIGNIKKMDTEDDTTTYVDDEMSNNDVLRNLMDCPKNLISELKKYQYN